MTDIYGYGKRLESAKRRLNLIVGFSRVKALLA